MTSVSFERFVSPDYQLTYDPIEIPQLGKKAKTNLKDSGIVSTLQIIGHFLRLGGGVGSIDDMTVWLKQHGAPETHAKRIAQAIAERVTRAGVKVQVAIPHDIVQSSRLDDDKVKDIVQRKLTGVLEHDFQGCGLGKPGKPSASVASLHANGITDSYALIGAFLSKFDGTPTEEKVTEFYKELGEASKYGVAKGYKATLIEAIKLKLSVGLDATAAPMLSSIVEEEEAPGTGQKSRVRPPMAAASIRTTPPAPKAPSVEIPASPSKTSSAPFVMLGAFVVMLAIYFALPSTSTELALY